MSARADPRAPDASSPTRSSPLVYLYGIVEAGNVAHRLLLDRSIPGLEPDEQLFAVDPFGLCAPPGSDEMLGASHPRREDPQFVRGEGLLDEVPELESVFGDVLREKLPRLDAARSAGLPVKLDLGGTLFHGTTLY